MKTISIMIVATMCAMFVSSAFAEEDIWITDFAAAKKISEEKKLPILADFSGSDWCGWCIKLEKEVFSQDEFKKYAKDNVVLFLADFPAKKKQSDEVRKQNQELQKEYGIQGFPTVLLLNFKGDVLSRTGYRKGGAAEYVKHLEGLIKSEK